MPASARREAIYRLWDSLADFGAPEVEPAVQHLLHGLTELVGAQNAWWLGTVRLTRGAADDPLFGWRPGGVRHLKIGPEDRRYLRQNERWLRRGAFDDSLVAMARGAGSFRILSLAELFPPERRRGEVFQIAYASRGIRDALFVGCPVNADAEAVVGVHRTHPAPLFRPADRAALASVLRGLRWFHRRVLLHSGLTVASRPLTATERRVIALLLTDVPESAIGERLGLARGTAHNHVTAIYRKFGVQSRAALMALWLGRPAAACPAAAPAV